MTGISFFIPWNIWENSRKAVWGEHIETMQKKLAIILQKLEHIDNRPVPSHPYSSLTFSVHSSHEQAASTRAAKDYVYLFYHNLLLSNYY